MRRPLVAGNWKMHPRTLREAVELAVAVREATAGLEGVATAIAPPFTALGAVRGALAGSHLAIAAQDVHEEEAGAFTGGVSAGMLRELVDMVVIGHSEVRRDRGDTDARVNAKLRRAVAERLQPIVCVGEALEVRRDGGADEFVRGQIRRALDGIDLAAVRVVVAYEPIWAIGTGVAARGEDARATIGAIRDEIRTLYGRGMAETVEILYGGSVNARTIGEFAGQEGIDGALVGGASLKSDEFGSIARAFSDPHVK
jgi:triosephosphate isomerase (TIM)